MGNQEDLFGDQYLSARATSVYTLTKAGENLKMRNPKNRHAKEEDDYLIHRTAGLGFTYVGTALPQPENILDQIVQNQKAKKEALIEQPTPFGEQ